VGDTIVGEIFLSHRDSILLDNRNFLFGYECDGYFMGVIDQGNEEYISYTFGELLSTNKSDNQGK